MFRVILRKQFINIFLQTIHFHRISHAYFKNIYYKPITDFTIYSLDMWAGYVGFGVGFFCGIWLEAGVGVFCLFFLKYLIGIIRITMQQNQTCAICQKQPQDLLVLVCGHNLCVSCATQIYTLNGGTNPFVCEICLMETELDQQTISHFQSATERNHPKNQKKQKATKPPKSKSPQKKYETQKNNCKIHNELALYYCFNCNAADICSECILTPKHNTHRVVTLKKAMQSIQKKIQQQIKACQFIRIQLNQQREYLGLRKAQCHQSFMNKKQQIKEAFDEIARTVSDRYSSLCSEIQQECARSLQIYEAYIVQVNEKQRMVDQSIKVQKRSQAIQSESMLLDYISGLSDSKGMFTINLPKQLPTCSISLSNSQTLCYQIGALLNKFGWGKGEDSGEAVDYSMIGQENPNEQPSKTALKQSQRGSINMNRSNNRVGSSRKLDLSRSIQNATYIINRLQQRSRNI